MFDHEVLREQGNRDSSREDTEQTFVWEVASIERKLCQNKWLEPSQCEKTRGAKRWVRFDTTFSFFTTRQVTKNILTTSSPPPGSKR